MRSRGEKDAVGRTKCAILLYLAGGDVYSFSSVREHLKETSNIRNTKNIRAHLKGLADEGLILKTSGGNGNADAYEIPREFNVLKRLFNFFKANNALSGLMGTALFARFTASEEFRNKVIISMIRTYLLQIDQIFCNEKTYEKVEKMIRDLPHGNRKTILDWMERIRNGESGDIYKTNFYDMIDRYRVEDIDALHDMFFRLFDLYRSRYPIYTADDYRIMISELIIPENYKVKFFQMIRLSPSACDYVINALYGNALFSSRRLTGYFLSFLALFPEMYDFSIDEHSDMGYVASIDPVLRRDFIGSLSDFRGEPSTYLMVKSLFISDMVYGRLSHAEIPEEIEAEIAE